MYHLSLVYPIIPTKSKRREDGRGASQVCVGNHIGGQGGAPRYKSDPKTLKCPIIGHIWVQLLDIWVYIAIFVSEFGPSEGGIQGC